MYSNPADRRAFGRRPTNQHAMAHIAGRAPQRCVVRNISEGGALLDFGDPVVLRNRLRLVWEGTGEHAECEVRHVQGGKAGVQFICPNGPRIAREAIAAGAAKLDDASLPPLAPAPSRSSTPQASGALVQKFRQARQPVETVAVPAPEAVGVTVPLPMPAAAYASAPAN